MGNQQESLNKKDLIPIPGLDGYFASIEGDIFSIKRGVEPRKLSQYMHYGRSKNHYMRLKIASKLMLSHRVIASILVGRQLYAYEVVNHLNGDTADNKISNLDVVSQHENVSHAVQAKLYCHGSAWYKARGMQEC